MEVYAVNQRVATLRGRRVILREPRRDDADDYVRWEKDDEVRYWTTSGQSPAPRPENEVRAEHERIVARSQNPVDQYDKQLWEIDTTDGVHIGSTGHYRVDKHNRKTTVAIVIYEREYWNRGYGTEALQLLLRHLFQRRKLHRVELRTLAENARMIRCAEKCGFRTEGLLRDARYFERDGEYHDDVTMGVLASDVLKQP